MFYNLDDKTFPWTTSISAIQNELDVVKKYFLLQNWKALVQMHLGHFEVY